MMIENFRCWIYKKANQDVKPAKFMLDELGQ